MEYLIIKNFLDKSACQDMVSKLDALLAKGLYLPPDDQCTISPAFYGVFNDEALIFLPKIEGIVNKKLFPTYTYSRIYQQNEILLPHTDRDECEYSFTLSLKENDWPIYIQTNNGVVEILLGTGDILLYKGIENLHWRMPLRSGTHYQAFFHYVDQDGAYKNKKYDGKESFATSEEAIEELKRKRDVLQ